MREMNFLKGLLALCIANMIFAGGLAAKTFRDDFDDKDLSDLWVEKVAGKASREVKDGQLVLTSADVADGINVCYTVPLKGDITCEVGFDTTGIEGGFAHLGFFDDILEPMINVEMHPHYVNVFYCDKDRAAGVINDGKPAAGWNRVIGDPNDVPLGTGEHVWRIEVKGRHAQFFIDGKLEGEGDTVEGDRYFIISPDPYTSHYTGRVAVDYVELTGVSVVSLAVESSGKLATAWGILRVR